MRKPKLTRVELSRILSQNAVGKLRHYPWGSRDDDEAWAGCGCIAGAAYELGAGGVSLLRGPALGETPEMKRAVAISAAVVPPDYDDWTGDSLYPAETPEELLAYLHSRGVA